METPEPNVPRRPRFSYPRLLLLTALSSVAIFAGLLWSDVGPLRNVLKQWRAASGQLSIADPSKIYAVRLETIESDTWKWRIYLPKGTVYDLRTIVGTIRGKAAGMSRAEWFEIGIASGGSSCVSPGVEPGEFTLTVALRPGVADDGEGSTWVLATDYQHEATPAITRGGECDQAGMDWMDDSRARGNVAGDALLTGEQYEFDASHGLELLTLLRSEVIENAGGWSTNAPDPTQDNDGAAVWIVPRITKPLPTPSPPR